MAWVCSTTLQLPVVVIWVEGGNVPQVPAMAALLEPALADFTMLS
jgi:hypothetical protein